MVLTYEHGYISHMSVGLEEIGVIKRRDEWGFDLEPGGLGTGYIAARWLKLTVAELIAWATSGEKRDIRLTSAGFIVRGAIPTSFDCMLPPESEVCFNFDRLDPL
jgi:hypothetical protein